MERADILLLVAIHGQEPESLLGGFHHEPLPLPRRAPRLASNLEESSRLFIPTSPKPGSGKQIFRRPVVALLIALFLVKVLERNGEGDVSDKFDARRFPGP